MNEAVALVEKMWNRRIAHAWIASNHILRDSNVVLEQNSSPLFVA